MRCRRRLYRFFLIPFTYAFTAVTQAKSRDMKDITSLMGAAICRR